MIRLDDNLLSNTVLCDIAGVSRSGCYRWCAEEPKWIYRKAKGRVVYAHSGSISALGICQRRTGNPHAAAAWLIERGQAERREDERSVAGSIVVWNGQAWCMLAALVTIHGDVSAGFLFRGENRTYCQHL